MPGCAVAASSTVPAPVTVIGALITMAPLALSDSVLAPESLIEAPTVIGAFGAVVRTARLESSKVG
jgi:hypothetical protein